jgi:hypothetical protein
MSIPESARKELKKSLRKADRACRAIESALKISLDDEMIEFGISTFEDCSEEVTITACLYVPSWDVERTYTIGSYSQCYVPEVNEIMEGALVLLSLFVLDHMISSDTQASIMRSFGYVRESRHA